MKPTSVTRFEALIMTCQVFWRSIIAKMPDDIASLREKLTEALLLVCQRIYYKPITRGCCMTNNARAIPAYPWDGIRVQV